ncbi:hypothetical protein D3C87_2059200 [compost metagenome]
MENRQRDRCRVDLRASGLGIRGTADAGHGHVPGLRAGVVSAAEHAAIRAGAYPAAGLARFDSCGMEANLQRSGPG